MKKLLTLGNCLRCCALALGLVAFCFMFGDQVGAKGGLTGTFYTISFSDAFFTFNGTLGFVGYILIGIAALCTCFLTFNGLFNFVKLDKNVKLVCVALTSLLFLLGGIFVLCLAAVIGGVSLTAFSIIAGILAIVSAILVCLSFFVER